MEEERLPSFFKFEQTSRGSLVNHLMLLVSELKDRSLNAMDNNEKFWYRDAAILVYEVKCRYEKLESQREFQEKGTIGGLRMDSER